MLEEDIDDTHLCIKCSTTIVGIDNYVQHRKNSCSTKNNRDIVHVDHPYGTFDFTESTSYHHHHHHHHHKSEEVEKPGKSLSESYDLPYDLGADVFFSSLELQSSSKRTLPTATTTTSSVNVSSTNNPSNSSSGKHSSSSRILTRKATAALLSQHETTEDEWIEPPSSSNNNSDNLMKAVRDISGNKKCEPSVFKLITFQHDSPEPESEDDDDDDEDYEAEGNTVPASHTGGKWKPDNHNSSLRHHNLLRNSPSFAWDDRHQNLDDVDEKSIKILEVQDDFDLDFNPPPGHTKGKWVPGTKVIKLDYKAEVEIEKIYTHQYWCNTCNRKLASKLLYERHLKSNLHLKRSEPEQELEQATLKMITLSERIKKPSKYLNPLLYVTQSKSDITEKKLKNLSIQSKLIKKRKRRKYFIKCDVCKTRLPKYLLGKHLISHYHYRRMIQNPSKSYEMILENMDKIVRQAPYQCQPCQFYTNTENDFLWHWNTSSHRDITEGPGRFWCSFCKFECEDNNQMRRHLLSIEHKEVVLAINRSVPIIIGKKLIIECVKCKQIFRYNIELRKHAEHCTAEPTGTASNDYQSKFSCNSCNIICKSRLSLQRHELLKHKRKIFYCSICEENFKTANEAKKHRTTLEHKINSAKMSKNKILIKKCKICNETFGNLLELKEHLTLKHPDHKCLCPHCGQSFLLPQEVGRHVRDKQCHLLSTTVQNSTEQNKTVNFTPISTEEAPHTSTSDPSFITTVSQNSSYNFDNDSNPSNFLAVNECRKDLNNSEHMEKNSSKELQSEKHTTFSCQTCNFTTSLKSELLYHEIFHKEENIKNEKLKLSCPICKKLFRKHSLRCHLRQHTNEKIFNCEYCKMNFAWKHNLKNHILNCHEMKKNKTQNNKRDIEENQIKYQCDTCGKFFKRRFSLKQHISVHGERDKKFTCPMELCIFIGRNASDLKAHLSVHSIEKNFKCDYDGCNYMGKTLALLKKHSKKHKPSDREFSCPECNFTAKIPGHMKRHMRIHTGEKPYKCPYCSYTCNNSENLRKHVLFTTLHAGKCLYECTFCDSNSQFKTNFQREYRAHLVVVHHIETNLNQYINI